MKHKSRPLLRVREAMTQHPRIPRAFKAAVASVLAWLIVQPIGGVADDYPYYAPLGAVIAVSPTVVDSVRASVRGVLAILLGACLAMIFGHLLPGVLALAVVVLVGTIVAGWWRLGDMGGWVPISALFVLIIGHVDPTSYVVGYVGLTSLGALVGTAINAVFPPLPLETGARQIAAVQRAVADQLADLADALRHDEPLTDDQWLDRYHDMRPHAGAMARLVIQTSEARRVNWRVERWRRRADEQAAHALALERLSLVVEDLAMLLIDTSHGVVGSVVGPRLDGLAAEALESVADALRVSDDGAGRERLRAAEAAIDRYVEALSGRDRDTDKEFLTAGTIATALRQVITSLAAKEDGRSDLS